MCPPSWLADVAVDDVGVAAAVAVVGEVVLAADWSDWRIRSLPLHRAERCSCCLQLSRSLAGGFRESLNNWNARKEAGCLCSILHSTRDCGSDSWSNADRWDWNGH